MVRDVGARVLVNARRDKLPASSAVECCEWISINFNAASADEVMHVCNYRGVCAQGEYRGGHRLGWLQPVRRLKPVIPPRSVRESGEQRVQIDPRVYVQVRQQVALAADGRGVVGGAQLRLRARQLGDSGGLSQLIKQQNKKRSRRQRVALL